MTPLHLPLFIFLLYSCIHFITGKWNDLWNTPGIGGLNGIVTWNQSVYGNAKTSPNGTITCQHGSEECLMNTLQNCAIAHATNASQWVPFIVCLENYGSNQQKYASKCAKENHYDWTTLNTCWTGAEGKKLDAQAAANTPNHDFVPWLLVDGTNYCTNSNCDDVLTWVCNAYTGPKPSACN